MIIACVEHQMFVGNQQVQPLPLIHVKTKTPFQQWGLDFIGEINTNLSGKHKWIVTTIDYFNKWVEAIPTKEKIDTIIIKFLEENILGRFGYPRSIISDNSKAFKSFKHRSWELHFLLSMGKWFVRSIQQEPHQ
jgi:hypothetical protein